MLVSSALCSLAAFLKTVQEMGDVCYKSFSSLSPTHYYGIRLLGGCDTAMGCFRPSHMPRDISIARFVSIFVEV